ncbi:MAG: hypothetical protein MJK10_02285 [Pseudomonadales bacterium]|nr:hypothetical protein [Pseudomonadales bacterium]NRA14695.1 hypothetical protein [Oceanospirillaceae bacterium]
MSLRSSANSMQLQEGTGNILAMIPCGDFIEMFKIDKSFRVQTPAGVDPDGLNPNAPWTASIASDIGSMNKIVARVFIQSYEIIQPGLIKTHRDINSITLLLHKCKEALLACENEANQVIENINAIIIDADKKSLSSDNQTISLNPFPHVSNLDSKCGSFLIFANRAIKYICELPSYFIDLDGQDSNFDHLLKRIKKTEGSDSNLLSFIDENADAVRYLIELRNFHEHPKKKRTIIQNFKLLPNMKIHTPVWGLDKNELHPIKESMINAVNFLTELAEAMFIQLVLSSESICPVVMEEITNIEKSMPIKYRLSIDSSKIGLK